MARRRGNGEGSIHQLPSGSWRAQVSINGRRLSKTARTQREVREWLKETINQVDRGLTYESTKTELSAFLAGWLTSMESSVRYKTHLQYSQIVRDYINPALGDITIGKLRPDHVQALLDSSLAAGIGKRTVELIYTVLHGALGHALTLGVVTRNVTAGLKVPHPEKQEMPILNDTQIGQLLLAVKGTRNEALYRMAVVTGMREGELLGLKWTDLDWLSRRLQIRRQAQYRIGEGLFLVPLKTEYARRTIRLGTETVELLREHEKRQQEARQAAGERWKENGLVFPSTVGTIIESSNLYQQWARVVKKSGIPSVRFHDLRHTAASIMIQKLRMTPLEVCRILGHSKPSITLDIYSHLFESVDETYGDRMDEFVSPVEVDLDISAEI